MLTETSTKIEGLSTKDQEMMKTEQEKIIEHLQFWKDFCRKNEGSENSEIKDKIYQELEFQFPNLLEELHITVNADLAKKIQNEPDLQKKSEFQQQLIEDLSQKLYSLPSEKWSFYPKRIKETKKLNCSATSMLLNYLLGNQGLDVKIAMPYGHVANIAILADGKMLYVDARRGMIKEDQNNKLIIEGFSSQLLDSQQLSDYEDVTILKVPESSNYPFTILPVMKKESGIVASFLANLAVLNKENENSDFGFDTLQAKLFPELQELYRSYIWQQEGQNVQAREKILSLIN